MKFLFEREEKSNYIQFLQELLEKVNIQNWQQTKSTSRIANELYINKYNNKFPKSWLERKM